MQMPDIQNSYADIDVIENSITREKHVDLFCLRLDKIHDDISGNKLFKLHNYLQTARAGCIKTLITFGGAYSNHLAATAVACKLNNLSCIAMVRGEKPALFSHTLKYCLQQGMRLNFISREDYRKKDDSGFIALLKEKFGEHILVPEGGYSKEGMKGAALISNLYKKVNYTHICCAVGTSTTFAGLISSNINQKIIGFNVLKTMDNVKRIENLLNYRPKNYAVVNAYHFGGYAKYTDELILFMNKFYKDFSIPTDFVYTGKMMFGVFDLIQKDYFPLGSKILCVHSGGLQGNKTLCKLNF